MKPYSIKRMARHGIGPIKVFENKTIEPNLPYLREGTVFNLIPMNFTLTQGGMGDYICWTIALQWLVKEAPWIAGRVFAPQYFIEFARYFFDDVPNWKVFLVDDFDKFAERGSLIRGPTDQNPQLINAVGASLVDLGFAYFANLCPAPAGITYPKLDLGKDSLPSFFREEPGKYIVFTPGGTTFARIVRGRHLNPIIRWAKEELGLTPVFLGRHHLADIHFSYYDDDIDFSLGLDLREKTTLLEAAAIMKYSACVFGLDNGLLHLACCTDADVIFGYNIAHPSQRRPIRHSGRTREIVLTQQELACIHCQTNVKLLAYHNFRNCIYEDADKEEAKKNGVEWSPKCIDVLFDNQGQRWKKEIERTLNAKKADKEMRDFVETYSVHAPDRAA